MSLMSIEDEERVGLVMNLVDTKDGGMEVAMHIGLHARGITPYTRVANTKLL